MKKKILVHICCAPDALYVMDLLRKDFEIHGFFYNPNIHPLKEYEKRLKESKKVAGIIDFKLYEAEYNKQKWFDLVEKFKDEPEKGRRCDVCYAMRLEKTARKTAELGFDIFATVMSLSPWKKAEVMNRMGKMFARRYNIEYLEANFKKKDGFKKSIELGKKNNLYRQNYCGCEYSRLSQKTK